jgi:HprK-related kinase B
MAETFTTTSLLAGLHPPRVLPRALDLALGDFRVRVKSNQDQVLGGLAHYFGPFVSTRGDGAHLEVTALQMPAPRLDAELIVKQPDPGKNKIKEEYLDLADGRVVAKRLTGMLFVFSGQSHFALGPCLENLNQVVNFVNNRHIQWELDRGALLAHAAAVCSSRLGMAMAGFSGMGKSTLALHLMSRGLDFVSNDRLMIRRDLQGVGMAGVAKLPRINPGTALNNPDLAGVLSAQEREQFQALAPDELWCLEHKYDVFLEDCFGPDRFRLRGGLHALVLLNWQRGQGAPVLRDVDLAERLDLLGAFKKEPGLFYLPPDPGPDHSDQAYLTALAGVRVIEISGGVDFQAAADACLNILERS